MRFFSEIALTIARTAAADVRLDCSSLQLRPTISLLSYPVRRQHALLTTAIGSPCTRMSTRMSACGHASADAAGYVSVWDGDRQRT